jgi:mRNA interferase RelE/StbE
MASQWRGLLSEESSLSQKSLNISGGMKEKSLMQLKETGRYRIKVPLKEIIYSVDAIKDLRQHANRRAVIMAKVDAYAKNPAAHANNIKKLKGRPDYRLRVGDFRVIFTETETTITIHSVGPRGEIYD